MSLNDFFLELTQSDDAGVSMTKKQIGIMSAAIEIFAEKGYSATTTSEIAKKAGVGEGTIFHHYKTKKDLLLAIPDYLNRSPYSKESMEELISILAGTDRNFEDFVRAVILNRRDFVLKNLHLIKVLFQEIALHPELREEATKTVLMPAMGKLIQAMDRFKEKRRVIDIPSACAAKLMLTSAFGYFFTRYIAGITFEGDRECELDDLIRYIVKGLSAKEPVTKADVQGDCS